MIERLLWDSDFFNFEIGKIHVKSSDILFSENFITTSLKYKLIYIFSSVELIEESFKLVDIKVVFEKKIEQNESNIFKDVYCINEINDELEELVYLSGTFSRFYLDPNFSITAFRRLYSTWITNSLNDSIKSKVFVKFIDSKIVGFVSVRIKGSKGIIELISVNNEYQGLNIGSELILAAEMFCLNNKINKIEVATQFANKKAIVFYNKNHFKSVSTTFIYHKWIKS